MIGNQEVTEEIIDIKVGKRTESDHMPLEIEIGGSELQKNEEKKEEEKEKRKWTNESMEKYLEECKDWICNGRTVEKMWTEIKKKINIAIPKKKVKIRRWGMGERAWYDKEWKERKREMRRKVTMFMKGKCSREALIEEKKGIQTVVQPKKGKTRGRRNSENQEDQNKTWKYINKYRRRREGIEISEGEWKTHFMEILEGTEHKEGRKTKEHRAEEKTMEEREDNIEKEEVIYQLRNLKEKEVGEVKEKLSGSC